MKDFTNYFLQEGPGIWICVQSVAMNARKGRVEIQQGSRFTLMPRFIHLQLPDLLDAIYDEQHARPSSIES